MACAFSCGESPIVLQAEANEEVDLPVRHIHDLLDSFLGLVVVGQERQFTDEFRPPNKKNDYSPRKVIRKRLVTRKIIIKCV